MTSADMIADLRAKAEKATKGPWGVEDPMGPETLSIISNPSAAAYDWKFVAMVHRDGEDHPVRQGNANAALIVAMRNNLERLLDLASTAATARDAGRREGIEAAAKVARGQLPLDVHEESPNYGLGMPRTDLERGIVEGRKRAATAIRSLSAQLAEARNMLDIEKQAAQQHILERLNQRDRATASQSEIDALRERIGVLEKALEPFAEAATKGEIGGYPPNYFVGATEFENARRARSALEGRDNG